MSSVTTSLSDSATKFVRVPTSILRTLDQTRVDLFLQHNDEPQVLYRDAGYPLSHDRAEELFQNCEDALLVRSRDLPKFRQDLAGALEQALEEEAIEPSKRFEILQFAVSMELEQALQKVSCEQYVAETQTIGRQIASLLDASDVLPGDLFDIVRHDFQTFVHVTNVTGYGVLLAKAMGIRDRHELEKIAVGGLLHDIGKRHIPRSILTKTGALTAGEWEIIRQHPQRGYEELCHREQLEHDQLMMVYQHHEHVDGRGYPVGITGAEMHPWAKLLAVVDVFDALTGDRPYRLPASKNAAIDFIQSKSGTQFDEECVRCWVSAMQLR
jgi:HD-GYP domain-containing protein (c-di-GMP phosphodiesterase class II)